MKKKHRCLLQRFAALVAALVISFSLPVSALAASGTEADMPSLDDFRSHHGSWFVWRQISLSGVSFYELTGDPVSYPSASSSSFSVPSATNYFTDAFDVSVNMSNGKVASYACSFPAPLHSYSGFWSDLPSFPVTTYFSYYSPGALVRCYVASPSDYSGVKAFLTSAYSSSDKIVSSSYGSSANSDSLDLASFSSPFFAYPFAFRTYSSTSSAGFALQGGSSGFLSSPTLLNTYINLSSSRFLVGYDSFITPSNSYSLPSSDLGIVFAKTPSFNYITNPADFNVTVEAVFTLLVPTSFLPDVKIGDWLSDSPEDLQDAITNQFGVDSDTLQNSKDNLNSWNSTSSVDSDVASGASGLLVGLFQNLGTFLFSVSLLCFGAVFLRMLIRKAVDG